MIDSDRQTRGVIGYQDGYQYQNGRGRDEKVLG